MARHQSGWFKVWRDAWDKDLGQNVYLWALWTALLQMATWKETKIIWEGKQRVLPPGSVVFGITELAVRWECSRSVVQKWLKYLNDTGRIVVATCPRGTLVTISNWSLYQGSDEDEKIESEATTRLQRGYNEALNEEVKNKEYKYKQRKRCSKIESNFDLEKLYQEYPRKRGKTPGLATLAKQIQSEADYQDLATAIKNYSLETAKELPQHKLHFSTFANQWRDWIQVEPDSQEYSINTKPIKLEAR